MKISGLSPCFIERIIASLTELGINREFLKRYTDLATDAWIIWLESRIIIKKIPNNQILKYLGQIVKEVSDDLILMTSKRIIIEDLAKNDYEEILPSLKSEVNTFLKRYADINDIGLLIEIFSGHNPKLYQIKESGVEIIPYLQTRLSLRKLDISDKKILRKYTGLIMSSGVETKDISECFCLQFIINHLAKDNRGKISGSLRRRIWYYVKVYAKDKPEMLLKLFSGENLSPWQLREREIKFFTYIKDEL